MLITCLGQARLYADDFVDDLKCRYGFTNWVGNTEINYSCLITNWTPTFASFGVTGLIATHKGLWANGSKNSTYFFHSVDTQNAIIDLRVQECRSVVEAHAAMMEVFGNCSAIQPFPVGTTNTVKVGDRCYIGYPTNACSRIFFVRNNVFLSIAADQTNFPVQTIAENLDNQLKVISSGEARP